MSRLLYIRHAQASFMKENYDQLSDLGFRQSLILGQHLVASNYRFNKIYVGPLVRHWQTMEKVQEAYTAKGISLPEPVQIEELKEHQGMEVMARLLPQLIAQYDVVKKWTDEAQENPTLRKKNHLRIFTWFMKRWAADQIELAHPADLEPWSVFRKRVSQGMEKIISDQEKGLNIAVFTSGGTVAASLGHALEMEKEERIVELNGIVKNTSMTTFLFSSGRVSLQSFNEVPHLSEKELITYV